MTAPRNGGKAHLRRQATLARVVCDISGSRNDAESPKPASERRDEANDCAPSPAPGLETNQRSPSSPPAPVFDGYAVYGSDSDEDDKPMDPSEHSYDADVEPTVHQDGTEE